MQHEFKVYIAHAQKRMLKTLQRYLYGDSDLLPVLVIGNLLKIKRLKPYVIIFGLYWKKVRLR